MRTPGSDKIAGFASVTRRNRCDLERDPHTQCVGIHNSSAATKIQTVRKGGFNFDFLAVSFNSFSDNSKNHDTYLPVNILLTIPKHCSLCLAMHNTLQYPLHVWQQFHKVF